VRYPSSLATYSYPLSLHDALPIYIHMFPVREDIPAIQAWYAKVLGGLPGKRKTVANSGVTDCVYFHRFNVSFSASPMKREPTKRSEEHTSELQSRVDLVCRLLLEK